MEEHPKEDQSTKPTGLNNWLARLYQPGPLIAFFSLAILGLLSLGYFILTDHTPPETVVIEQTQQTNEQPTQRAYEEDTSSDVEDKVKQADLAIIEAMKAMELNMVDLDLLDVEIRKAEGKGYHYQVLQLPAVDEIAQFHKHLQAYLAKRLPEAKILILTDNEFGISINELPTHRLLLKTVPLTLPPPTPEGPKLAIVIDDIGENMTVLKGLLGLDMDVTYAVWPNATHTKKSVQLITKDKRDLIIHFPMEPRGYPRYNPGEDALFISMTKEAIEKRVAENIAQIPEAVGVNNHMGSRFTANMPGMVAALSAFKAHGLFFLDSLTTGKSVAREAARKADIPFYVRNIFIDNVKDINAIIHQLKKAENVALKQGYSVAIGHPYKETLAAIEKWDKTKHGSITIIPLSSLKPEKLD